MRYAHKVMSPVHSRRIRMSVLPFCSTTLAVQILPGINGDQKSDRSANLPISRGVLENLPLSVNPLSEKTNIVENMYVCELSLFPLSISRWM